MNPSYKVYLRDFSGHILGGFQTVTSSRQTAFAAFMSLIENTDSDGQPLVAELSGNNRHLARHRFDRSPGDSDYCRGMPFHEVPWDVAEDTPRIGRPKAEAPGRNVTIYMYTDDIEKARAIGDGNLSQGIRKALEAYPRKGA